MIAVACGCANEPKAQDRATATLGGLHIAQADGLDAMVPLALGARVGIEHHAWMTDDTGDRVARVLSAYENEPVPIDVNTRERLRRSGLRIVAVPIEDVMKVHAALPPKLTWRREWAGQLTAWTELLRGRTIGERLRLIVDGQEVIMPPGTPRFIARAWAAPTSAGAVLRTEIGVQIHEANKRNPARALYDPAVALTVPQQGRVLDAVTFRADLLPLHAIFIVSDSSDANWTALIKEPVEAPEPSDETGAEGTPETAPEHGEEAVQEASPFEVLSGGEVIAADLFGPATARPTELGVYMLSGLDRSYRPIKAVFVLIPRVPAQYSVLP